MTMQSGAAFAQPRFVSDPKLQALAYLGVSILALGCDTAAYLLLAMAGAGAIGAAAAGYMLGLVVHFALSKSFVFARTASDKGEARLFAEFAASGIAGLVLTVVVIEAMVSGLGFALLPAKIVAVAVSFVAVFLLRRFIVFAG